MPEPSTENHYSFTNPPSRNTFPSEHRTVLEPMQRLKSNSKHRQEDIVIKKKKKRKKQKKNVPSRKQKEKGRVASVQGMNTARNIGGFVPIVRSRVGEEVLARNKKSPCQCSFVRSFPEDIDARGSRKTRVKSERGSRRGGGLFRAVNVVARGGVAETAIESAGRLAASSLKIINIAILTNAPRGFTNCPSPVVAAASLVPLVEKSIARPS